VTPKCSAQKKKTNSWTSSKLKTLDLWKNPQRMKRQATEWKKIFANYPPNRRLTSEIYKELLKLHQKKKPNQEENRIDLQKHLLKKTCLRQIRQSTSLVL